MVGRLCRLGVHIPSIVLFDRIPLASFFLKHQKISNHEWIRINTNFSYLGLPASDFHECQFVVKPSVGLEPRLLISDSKSV